jgi:hypothetical protein
MITLCFLILVGFGGLLTSASAVPDFSVGLSVTDGDGVVFSSSGASSLARNRLAMLAPRARP